MTNGGNSFMPAMLILGLLIMVSLDFTVAQTKKRAWSVSIGEEPENKRQRIEHEPTLDALKGSNIERTMCFTNPDLPGIAATEAKRIDEPFEPTLDALKGPNIEVTMSVTNPELPGIAATQANADDWVRKYITNNPEVNFRAIYVGNEISPTSENNKFVFRAMQNIHNALFSVNRTQIRVTTSIAIDVLAKACPPKDGKFKREVFDYLRPIIQFLESNGIPIYASIYPYMSYLQTPGMDFRCALLDPSFPGVTTKKGITYDALINSVTAAVDKVLRSSPELIELAKQAGMGAESCVPTRDRPGIVWKLSKKTMKNNIKVLFGRN